MGQINIGLGVYSTPPVGTCGYGFSTQGKPIYIDAVGVAHELYSDVSVDGVSANILANLGVGLEADLPVASAGFTYVTNDTFKIYQGINDGIYDISDLKQGQLVTDTHNVPRTTYQLIGLELAALVGGSSVEICDQTDVEQAEPTENTKATSALRAWQGFVFWCRNTLFTELNTSDKTLVGSVNETYELAKNGSAVGGYANNLYFDETASDVVGYETLSYTPAALEATEVWTVNDSEGVKIFQNYLYPSAVSVSLIPAGQWSFQFWGNVSSGAGITKLGATYFKRSALGVETDLLTIWSSEIDNTTPDWIKFSLTFPNFTVEPTDRMGCRVIGQTTHNSDITITYVVGDGYGAWLNNPNRVRHTQLRDFNGDSTVQHIDNSTVKATPIDADKVALWDSVAGKMVTATISSIKTFLALIFRLKTEIGDAHGFTNPPNANNFTVSNTGASVTLNLLANAGNYKINGTEYVNAGLSRTFTASLGQNFLCIDSTGLIVSPLDIMNLTKIPCATVTWDGTKAIVGDELHTANRNIIQHKKEHDTDGARYVNGFATTFGAGAANTFSAATGIVRDEERYHTIGARTQAMICYRNVAGTAMLYDAPSANYAKVIGGLPQYDNAGVQTALGANNYGIMWMYVTNNKLPVNSEIVFVQGQASYANIGAAQAAPIPTLAGMSVAEWKLAYRVIIRRVANALVFIQADDYRLVAGGWAVNGGGLTSINAANVICTAPTGYTATDQQSLDNDLAANTIKGATATKATIVDADTIGVWDSVGNVFKKATALAFKTYVKLGLKASEILNDSLNVLGITLKDVLDNATLAIDGVTIQDADLFPIAREVEASAGVFTSVNMYHPWDRIKSELVDKHVYQYNVSTWAEVQNVLADPACRESVVFNLMQDMRVNTLSIYAKNIYFRGAKLIMEDNATLFIEPFIADTYNIYFDCLIETGFDNTPSLIRLGASSNISTINVKFKQFKGASTTIVPTIQFGKEGASNTVTASYNELVNAQAINDSITATQEDTFYTLQTEVTRVRVTTGGISLNNAFVGSLRPGWGLDNITTMWISGGGTNMEVRPQLQISGGTYDYIADAGLLRATSKTKVFNNYMTAPLFYAATGSANKFTQVTDNYTNSNKTIVISMTDSANAVIDVIIKTKRTI